MTDLLIKDIPEELHRRLKLRAKSHRCTIATEARRILLRNVRSKKEVGFGTRLASIGKELRLTSEEEKVFDNLRDKTPAKPIVLS